MAEISGPDWVGYAVTSLSKSACSRAGGRNGEMTQNEEGQNGEEVIEGGEWISADNAATEGRAAHSLRQGEAGRHY